MTAAEFYKRAGEFHHSGRLDEAIAACQQALGADPGFQPAWYSQGCAYEAQGNHANAVDCLRQAAALAPDHAESHHNLGKSLFNLGLVDEALDCFQAAIAKGAGFLPRTAIATAIPGSPRADNRTILAARRDWARTHLPPAASPRGVRVARTQDRPLRVGYLSAFFDQDKWMRPVWGLLNQHDRDIVQVHLFSDAPEAKCPSYGRHPQDQFHDISQLSNQAAARLISESRIEVLIDLNGFSRVDRLAITALKPAPVVAGWFNFYATSGLTCFDYLIGDREVVPPEEEACYLEKILRVPGSYLTFAPPEQAPEVAEPPSLATGELTFGCLASAYKITHPVVAAWARILQRAPRARLFLKNAALQFAQNRRFLEQRFAQHGVDPNRITMEGPAEHAQFVAAYRNLDIALDTFPYNGGTTTMEALWQGVPVLTFAGDRWAARQGASLLRAAGLPEYVSSSAEEYTERAVSLACSPTARRQLVVLRQTMRARLARASACNTAAFARHMEALYRQMTASA